jgi:hypothetical protein
MMRFVEANMVVSVLDQHVEIAPGVCGGKPQLEAILAETLIETLRHGFFGTARIEVSVQDGTIQHIRRVVERIEK